MNSKIKFSIVAIFSTLIIFSGCKKHDEKFLGPEYVAAPSDFAVAYNTFNVRNMLKDPISVLPGNATSVNIATRAQFYEANFNYKVRWTVEISSWKTHAKQTITGFGDYINETNCVWDGGSSNEYFFGYPSNIPDTVEVKLSFIGSDIVLRDTIKVLQMKKYYDVTYNGVYHVLIDDFEPSVATTNFSPFYPDQDDNGGGNVGNNAYNVSKNQGNFSYRMYGKDINNNTYLGSCNTPTLNDIDPTLLTETDPENVYVNLYIYGTGKPNTTVSIIAFENDVDPEVAVGTPFDQTINDKYIYQIGVTWKGWKLYSFKYSGFKRPNTGAGLGNNRLNPERLRGLALELDSYPTPGYEVEAFVDMVVVTEKGVFQK